MTFPHLRISSCVLRSFGGRSFSFTANRFLPRISRISGPQGQQLHGVPSFRQQLARTNHPTKTFGEQVKKPSVSNQIYFFVVVSCASFALAAEKTNVDTAEMYKRLTGFFRIDLPSSAEMRHTRYLDLGKKLQRNVDWLKDRVNDWPLAIKHILFRVYVGTSQAWLDVHEGQRACLMICAVNVAVWMAWKIPRLSRFMDRTFTHNPLSGLSYTLLTSVFSHKSFLHLLFNCMALSSFGGATTVYLRDSQREVGDSVEATTQWHFFAFYASAGVFAGLVSHVVRARIHFPRLVSQLSMESTTRVATVAGKSVSKKLHDIPSSLGASGAIYAAVTVTALAFPDTQIALFFPPTFPIPITFGVGGLVLIDIIGAFRGWRLLDHFAHLGGAIFGVIYWTYGPSWWNSWRNTVAAISNPGGRRAKSSS